MARKKTTSTDPNESPAAALSRDAAAALLGCPVREVVNVEDSPAGTIITTFDGSRLVSVPEDTPDAEGQTGLMFLTCPVGYRGAFPIYAQPLDDVVDEHQAVDDVDADDQDGGD